MACENTLTFQTGDYINDQSQVAGLSMYAVEQGIVGSYPGTTCDAIKTSTQSTINLLATSPLYKGVRADVVIDIASIFFATNAPTGPGSVFVFPTLDVNNVNYGNWALRYDDGVLVESVNNTTWGPTLDMSVITNFNITGAPGDFTIPNISWLIGGDANNYVDCLVPACATSTTALPSLGSTVKCANFSKIFNPLGIPFRSNK